MCCRWRWSPLGPVVATCNYSKASITLDGGLPLACHVDLCWPPACRALWSPRASRSCAWGDFVLWKASPRDLFCALSRWHTVNNVCRFRRCSRSCDAFVGLCHTACRTSRSFRSVQGMRTWRLDARRAAHTCRNIDCDWTIIQSSSRQVCTVSVRVDHLGRLPPSSCSFRKNTKN